MIGKGSRNDAVKEALKRNKAVYFAATGGAGALLAQRIVAARWSPTTSWARRPSASSRSWTSR